LRYKNRLAQLTGRKKLYAMIGSVFVVLLVIGIGANYNYLTMPLGQPQVSPDPRDSSIVASNFRVLSQAHTDVCAYLGNYQSNSNYISSLADNFYLQGSCCSPMDYTHYATQINGLKNYSNIPMIPRDPYNVSAPLAKQMISYAAMALTPAQQEVYDTALQMSKEGPCCCQCWAWYTHEGLAKALISQHGWNAQQIVGIWSQEDCCGGA